MVYRNDTLEIEDIQLIEILCAFLAFYILLPLKIVFYSSDLPQFPLI